MGNGKLTGVSTVIVRTRASITLKGGACASLQWLLRKRRKMKRPAYLSCRFLWWTVCLSVSNSLVFFLSVSHSSPLHLLFLSPSLFLSLSLIPSATVFSFAVHPARSRSTVLFSSNYYLKKAFPRNQLKRLAFNEFIAIYLSNTLSSARNAL